MTPFFALTGLIAVAAVTPGPNNFIVMTAAGRGGFRSALPAMGGVLLGALGLLTLVWAGAGAAFETAPVLRAGLKLTGASYLIWLGAALIWQTREPAGDEETPARAALPSTVLGVATFQFLNPKGWVLVLTATAAVPADLTPLARLSTLAGIFVAVSSVCLTVWACLGAAISERLKRPMTRRWFERAMGGLLVASAALLLL